MKTAVPSAILAAAAALALAGTRSARGEEAPHPPKKPYEHYKLIETRNIFAPPSAASVAGVTQAVAGAVAGTRPPVLTGIVYDAQSEAYKGLIESYGASEPRFVGPGDETVLGRVVRVVRDRIVIQGESREIDIPLGGTITPDGAPAAPLGADAPADAGGHQDVLERMKSRFGRAGESPPAAEDAPRAEPAPVEGISDKHRSILELLKERRRRSSGGTER